MILLQLFSPSALAQPSAAAEMDPNGAPVEQKSTTPAPDQEAESEADTDTDTDTDSDSDTDIQSDSKSEKGIVVEQDHALKAVETNSQNEEPTALEPEAVETNSQNEEPTALEPEEDERSLTAEEANAGQLPQNYIDTRVGSVEVEEHDGNLPTAGYERSPGAGAFIQSKNGEFRFQIGGYAQLRWTANWKPNAEETSAIDFTQGWSVRRAQLFFEGKYTDRFTFHFRPVIANSGEFFLQVAWLQVKLAEKWSLRLGKHFMPLSREDWMFPEDVLTTEPSPHASAFAFGSSYGAFVRYGGKDHRAWLAVHSPTDGGGDTFNSKNDVAASARWEWNIQGDNWSTWSDQIGRPGRPRMLMLGVGGLGYSRFGDNVEDVGARSQIQGHVDISLNGDGYQAFIGGTVQWRDDVDESFGYVWGMVAQLGYFVIEHVQLFAQYNLVGAPSQSASLEPFNSANVGASYFPFMWTNRWRFTLETGMTFSAINNTIILPSDNRGFLPSDERYQGFARLQAQFGF